MNERDERTIYSGDLGLIPAQVFLPFSLTLFVAHTALLTKGKMDKIIIIKKRV